VNLYLVVSEELTETICEDWYVGACHEEPYRIAELVVARNNSQARWLAWRADRNSFDGDMRDMPKFRTKCQCKNVDGPARIVSSECDGEAEQASWYFGDDELP